MNKKKCPQCKNLMLIDSPTCLYCGRPNKFVTKQYVKSKWQSRNNDFKYIRFNKFYYFYFLFFIILLFIIFIK